MTDKIETQPYIKIPKNVYYHICEPNDKHVILDLEKVKSDKKYDIFITCKYIFDEGIEDEKNKIEYFNQLAYANAITNEWDDYFNAVFDLGNIFHTKEPLLLMAKNENVIFKHIMNISILFEDVLGSSLEIDKYTYKDIQPGLEIDGGQ